VFASSYGASPFGEPRLRRASRLRREPHGFAGCLECRYQAEPATASFRAAEGGTRGPIPLGSSRGALQVASNQASTDDAVQFEHPLGGRRHEKEAGIEQNFRQWHRSLPETKPFHPSTFE
jgi:hypothetical protein